MSDCPICCDKFSSALRKEIKCPYCEYSACAKCVKQYVTGIMVDPDCMNCHVPWNREFFDVQFTKTFIQNDYKKHREDVLVEREKSLLPDTVELAQREKVRRDNLKLLDDLTKRKLEMQEEIRSLEKLIANIRRKVYYYNYDEDGGGGAESSNAAEKRSFTKGCPKEGCRGFLGTQWKCGICETCVCSDCHEIKRCVNDPDHVCTKENIETAKMIMKETRACPKCATTIYRSSGCDLMWCTMCHTSFSWKTGKEMAVKNNHNPEYLEWVRRNNNGVVPRAPGDIPLTCGGLPQYRDIIAVMKDRNTNSTYKYTNKVTAFYRWVAHMADYEMQYQYNVVNDNRDLRIAYLLKDIDEEEWKSKLQKKERLKDYKEACRQAAEMLVIVATDLFHQFVMKTSDGERDDVMKQFENLVTYYNESVCKVAKRFKKQTAQMFNDRWERASQKV